MLQVQNVTSGYGKKQVLFGLSLEIGDGEIVAVIGPNGSGKSTALRTISGGIPAWSGDILFDGVKRNGCSPAENVSAGLVLCPQGRRVFADMTVEDNLRVAAVGLRREEAMLRVESALTLFPALKERLRQEAGRLSGGEQQMVAIARALVPKPKVLLLDEPSLGLAPTLLRTMLEKVCQINCETGTSILIVEQKVNEVLRISHRVYSMKLGRASFSGSSQQLIDDPGMLRELFL